MDWLSIVRPGSVLSRQLGVEGAPIIDTAAPFRHGYGADALALRFNRAGVLSTVPNIYFPGEAHEFYTRHLASSIRGCTTSCDVELFWAGAEHGIADRWRPCLLHNRSGGSKSDFDHSRVLSLSGRATFMWKLSAGFHYRAKDSRRRNLLPHVPARAREPFATSSSYFILPWSSLFLLITRTSSTWKPIP